MKKILLCFIAAFALLHAYSQAGSLDFSFAGKGWTATDFLKSNSYSEDGRQVLLQSDGHYIVVFEVNGYTLLARYCSNGIMDTKFGTGGYSDPAPIFQPKAALQSDGKIVMAGYIYNTNTGNANADFALARYNSNGTLDNSFDGDGMQTTDFRHGDDYVNSLAIQKDGKIVVAGNAGGDFGLARYNSNGSLDNSFNGEGKLITAFSSDGGAQANSLTIQADGKIVVAGGTYNPNTGNWDFALARYNINGSMDNTFDQDGLQTTDFSGTNDGASSVAIQADGKIVVAGGTYNPNTGNNDFALARYSSNGTLDNRFSGDGKLTTDVIGGASSVAIQTDGKIVVAGGNALARFNTNGSLDHTFGHAGLATIDFSANSLVIQADDKIVLAGQTYNPNTLNNDFALARYNSNGTLDNSLDGDGKLTGSYLTGNTGFNAVAIQTNGKIVAAGWAVNPNTGNNDLALARYNSNGSLDNNFDQDGMQTTDFGSPISVSSLAIQQDGKIVVAGQAYNLNTSNSDFALARYNSNGTLDSSFGVNGMLTTDFGSDDWAYSLAIQRDGKIVAAGQAGGNFALARYNSNGTLDNSFDGDGKQTTDFFNNNDLASSLAIQTNGKIVVAGRTYNPNTGNRDFALARYNSNGSLDNSFDGDGKLTTDFFRDDDGANSLAIQTNGKIVVAGVANNPNTGNFYGNSDFALVRYNSNGSLDNSFDGDGKQTTDINTDFGSYDVANSLAIQTDGKIVVAGWTKNQNTGNYDFALVRYTSSGALDNSFSEDGKQTIDFFIGGYDIAAAVAIDNNRIYVAGYSNLITTRGILAAYQTGTTSLAAPAITSIAPLKVPQALPQQLTVTVSPNPAARFFTLKLQGGSTGTATVSITDAEGRLIEMKTNVNANSSLQLGHSYPRGIYFAQIVQGNKKEVVKLIKE